MVVEIEVFNFEIGGLLGVCGLLTASSGWGSSLKGAVPLLT